MRAKGSLPPAYFEDMYASTPDPWGFETSPYEQAKYDRTIEALGGRRYARTLEIGCANGVLTRRLAERSAELLAIDVSRTAVARARERCRDLAGVTVEPMAFPGEAPTGAAFDLVVISEVAYYWADPDLQSAGTALGRLLANGGDILLVHWTGDTDYPQSADDAVDKLRAAFGGDLTTVAADRTAEYRLDLWRRR